MEEKEYLYDAFISYRHMPLDEWVAGLVHKKLETFKVPKKLTRALEGKGITRVFRDREELVSNPNLREELEAALAVSRYLILICSSEMLKSEWVLKEVTTFKKLHGQGRILLLLIEGASETIIPEILREEEKVYTLENGEVVTIKERVEPLAADIRGKDKREMKKRLETELLRLIAPILGCRYDDLKQRHRERKRRKLVAAAVAAVMGIGAFGVFNAWRVRQIEQQMRAKLATQSRALADQAERLLEKGDRMGAILVALEALPKNLDKPEKPFMEEAEFALSEALYIYQFGLKMLPDKTLDYTNGLTSIKFSPEGTRAVSTSENGALQIWDVETSRLIKNISSKGTSGYYEQVDFVDEGRLMILDQDKLQLMDIESGIVTWEKEGSYLKDAFYLSPSKTKVAIQSDQLEILEVATGTCLIDEVVEREGEYGFHLAWNKAENQVAIGVNGEGMGRVFIFDMAKGLSRERYTLEEDNVNGLIFVDEGQVAVMTHPYHEELIDDLANKGNAKLSLLDVSEEIPKLLWENTFAQGRLSQLEWTGTDLNYLIVVGDNVLYVMEAEAGTMVRQFNEASAIIKYVQMQNIGVYCGFEDGNVKELCYEGNFTSAELDFKHMGGINAFDFAGGKIIMTADGDKKAYIYRCLLGQAEKELNEESEKIYSVKTSPSNHYFYTVGPDSIAWIWDAKTKERVYPRTFEGSSELLGFLREDEVLYIYDEDYKVTFYEAATGEVVGVLEGIDCGYIKNSYSTPEDTLYLYGEHMIYKIDGKSYQLMESVEYTEGSIKRLEVNAENQLLILNDEGILSQLDTKTNEETLLAEEVSSFIREETNKQMALYMLDGRLVVIDEASGRIYWTFENEGSNLSYMTFEEGAQKLWVGYEDTMLKIYDLKTGITEEFMEELSSPISRINFYPKQNRFVVFMNKGYLGESAIVYSKPDHKKLAYIEDIEDLDETCSAFYCVGFASTAYIVPFYTTKELVEEAHRQLEGRNLTDKEKRQLFITE